jgi:hypothetical protein
MLGVRLAADSIADEVSGIVSGCGRVDENL